MCIFWNYSRTPVYATFHTMCLFHCSFFSVNIQTDIFVISKDLFEGDIQLDNEMRNAIFGSRTQIRDVIIGDEFRWTNNTMYYILDYNLCKLITSSLELDNFMKP